MPGSSLTVDQFFNAEDRIRKERPVFDPNNEEHVAVKRQYENRLTRLHAQRVRNTPKNLAIIAAAIAEDDERERQDDLQENGW